MQEIPTRAFSRLSGGQRIDLIKAALLPKDFFLFFMACSYLEVVTDLLLNSLLKKVQGLKRMAEPHE